MVVVVFAGDTLVLSKEAAQHDPQPCTGDRGPPTRAILGWGSSWHVVIPGSTRGGAFLASAGVRQPLVDSVKRFLHTSHGFLDLFLEG